MILKWHRVRNSDELVIWRAKPYEIHGKGRAYGGGIRRDWTLWRNQTNLGSPSRLSEAKKRAQDDNNARYPDDLKTEVRQEVAKDPVQAMREHLERLQEASAGEDVQAQLTAFSAALDVALSRWPEIEEPYAY